MVYWQEGYDCPPCARKLLAIFHKKTGPYQGPFLLVQCQDQRAPPKLSFSKSAIRLVSLSDVGV
jgi:hypothetical protein